MVCDAADQTAADLRHFSPSCITVSNLKVIRGTAITTVPNSKKIERHAGSQKGRASLIRKSDDRHSKINNENEKRSR